MAGIDGRLQDTSYPLGPASEENSSMEDIFKKRLKAETHAAWWTVLAGIILVTVQWLAYMIFMASRPGWLPSLRGPGMTWPFVQTVWFWAAAGLKAFLWILALVALRLTFWSRQLRKQ